MVKIQRIKLKNYKSLQDFDFEFRDLNILIGSNGSGKSNFLSFFRTLQRAANENLTSEINHIGGFNDIRWKGAKSADIVSWHITFDELKEADSIHYITEIGARGTGFSITKEEISYPPKHGYTDGYKLLGAYNGTIRFLYAKQSNAEVDNNNSQPNVESNYNDNELALAQIRDPINFPLFAELRQAISDWTIFRGFGENAIQYIHEAQSLENVIPLRINPEGRNLISVLYALANETSYIDTQAELEDILVEAFPEFRKLMFPAPAAGKVELKWLNKNNWDFTARSISDGMLRFLGLATLLLLPNPPALIAIDEPEVGLHPKLIPVLSALLKSASKRTQVIVATHSPQLLSAEAIEPEDVVIVEKEDGQTKMERLEEQKLSIWLQRYSLGTLWMMNKLG